MAMVAGALHEGRLTPVAWVYGKLIVVALLWGGTFIAGRYLAQTMPLILAATARFAIALVGLVCLLGVGWRTRRFNEHAGSASSDLLTSQPSDRRNVLLMMGLGLTGIFLYNVGFMKALSLMPAGRTALFVALNPILTLLGASLFLKERLSGPKKIGVAVAFLGAAIVISRGDLASLWLDVRQSFGMGELCMLGAVTSWAAYTLLGRRALKYMTPLESTTGAVLFGVIFLSILLVIDVPVLSHQHCSWQAVAAVLYLGLMGTVWGFVWYYQGVREIGAARAAVFNNLVPVFGVLLAALILHEPILLSMWIGGGITLCGVMLVNQARY